MTAHHRLLLGASAGLALALAAGGQALAADAAHGSAIFKVTCGLCHMASANAAKSDLAMRIGPNLWGVVGRHSASLKYFNYSYAMRSSGIVWTNDQLRRYIAAPQKAVPNVRMSFQGLKNPRDAEDVLAYLSTLH